MSLPQSELEFLQERGGEYTLLDEGNMSCVVLRNFALPKGYDRPSSDLLLRLNPGFPDVPPDMWWFDPAVKRSDGQPIPNTEAVENYFGKPWQRWSRHLNPGQWRSGIDTLRSFVALIKGDLLKHAPPAG